MKKSSPEEIEEAYKDLREVLAREKAHFEATGELPDTSWTDDLPDDPLPGDEDEVSVMFVTRPKPKSKV